jgi:Pyruvate phosphate dikinase, AMP/ATP-binding domain
MNNMPPRWGRGYRALVALTIALLSPAAAGPRADAEGAPLGAAAGAPHASTAGDPADRYRAWITEMKENPRGPFSAIKWYCKDGSVFPPREYACAKRGGGVQHGEWSDRTRELRGRGYKVATLLAGLDAAAAVAAEDFPDTYAQLLVEKFLIGADDGWIFRRAQFYRGAIQAEDERDGARKLLIAMAARPEWIGYRYPALRSGARLLPHGDDSASAQTVRQMSATLSDRDAGFASLRAKIHNTPDAGDAGRVREYAGTVRRPELRARYEELAAEIDRVYRPRPLGERLTQDARALGAAPGLAARLADAQREYAKDAGALNRHVVTARLLADLRDALPTIASPALRLRVIDLSLAVEAEAFRAGAEVESGARGASRAAEVARLRAGVDAAYGTGLIDGRERAALDQAGAALSSDQVGLADYRQQLRYLGLLPGWSGQGLRQHVGEAMQKLAEIEPMADLFIQDQLRGSPVLFYAQVLDRLSRDANRLAGVQHRLFGRDVGAGFNALNPGLARGVLHAAPAMKGVADFAPDGIYLLPETVAALPPVAGILTTGAGNPLSHVQLLARNLGIPNVAIDESMVAALRPADGKRIVLAVSAAGLVEIAEDGPAWDPVFAGEGKSGADVVFSPDLTKLDLSMRDFVSLDSLRARDSGRIVGPKAAKLGELKAHFPDRVAPGVGIPFGVYRETVLDRPYRNTGQTVYQWMVQRFRTLEAMPPGSREAGDFAEKLRAEIYSIVRNTEPGPEFRQRLRVAMAKVFGPDFKGGVFVRSDTNVEDLPGFTGAGLNLTVPNVVGFDRVVKAIAEVWASPYTARAFAWRQSHMKGPEHVYPAVLLLRTVPADKSGVMITQDVDTGDRGVLSVATNEGVGGAVEGQAAESLRIDTRTGAVRLMATATAPRRMVPQATGGVANVPVTGSDTVLQPGEIKELIAVAEEIGKRVPQIGEDGKPVAADVEFAFVSGRLWLLQIRPLNESRQAQGNRYLVGMDRALAQNLDRAVDMRAAPSG